MGIVMGLYVVQQWAGEPVGWGLERSRQARARLQERTAFYALYDFYGFMAFMT